MSREFFLPLGCNSFLVNNYNDVQVLQGQVETNYRNSNLRFRAESIESVVSEH